MWEFGDVGMWEFENLKIESTPKTLKNRKPRKHRGHRGTQSIAIHHYELRETLRLCAFVAKKDFSEWTQY
jgi:hypothetical protein